ncbi:hypothetical protein D3C78_1911220 [compost metagenome]
MSKVKPPGLLFAPLSDQPVGELVSGAAGFQVATVNCPAGVIAGPTVGGMVVMSVMGASELICPAALKFSW